MSDLNSTTQKTINPFLAAMKAKMSSIETCKYSELNSKANKLDTARTKLINNYEAALELFNKGTVKQQYGLIVKDKSSVGNFAVKLKYGIYSLELDGIDGFSNVNKVDVAPMVNNIIEQTKEGLLDDALVATFAARKASNDTVNITTAA